MSSCQSEILYHAKGLGVDPELYGMTQAQLMKISQPSGLIEYVRKGNKLPSLEHVNSYQTALKNICQTARKRMDTKHYGTNVVTLATVYYDGDKSIIISFNQTTGDLITGDRQRVDVYERFKDHNILGGLKYINKWHNK